MAIITAARPSLLRVCGAGESDLAVEGQFGRYSGLGGSCSLYFKLLFARRLTTMMDDMDNGCRGLVAGGSGRWIG